MVTDKWQLLFKPTCLRLIMLWPNFMIKQIPFLFCALTSSKLLGMHWPKWVTPSISNQHRQVPVTSRAYFPGLKDIMAHSFHYEAAGRSYLGTLHHPRLNSTQPCLNVTDWTKLLTYFQVRLNAEVNRTTSKNKTCKKLAQKNLSDEDQIWKRCRIPGKAKSSFLSFSVFLSSFLFQLNPFRVWSMVVFSITRA